jgi:hypothetical protein
MISFNAHQPAEDCLVIVSMFSLRLPLSNVRSIQCAHCVPPSGIHAQQLGDIWTAQALLYTNLRLVSQDLSPSTKAERVGMVIELQQMLQCAEHRAWLCFLTGNEPWFYHTIDHDRIWTPDGEEVPTRPRRTIASPK